MPSREETLTVWTDGALAGPANSPAVRSIADRAAYGMAIEGGMNAAGRGFWISSAIEDGLQYDSVRQELMGMAYGLDIARKIHKAHKVEGAPTFSRIHLHVDCADAERRVTAALRWRSQVPGPDVADVIRQVYLLEEAGVRVEITRVPRTDAGIVEADRVSGRRRDRRAPQQRSGAEYFPYDFGQTQQEWIANAADWLRGRFSSLGDGHGQTKSWPRTDVPSRANIPSRWARHVLGDAPSPLNMWH